MQLIETDTQRNEVLGCPFRDQGGILVPDLRWKSANLIAVPLPTPLPLSWAPDLPVVHALNVHRKLATQVRNCISELILRGLWLLFKTYAGCYSVRFQRGSQDHPSVHCWGVALDFNADTMRRGSALKWPDEVVAVWASHGFRNGAEFHVPDAMHFEARKCYFDEVRP
jgi:hypothetical protein